MAQEHVPLLGRVPEHPRSQLVHEGVHPKRISERLERSLIKLTMNNYGHQFDGAGQESAAKMWKLFGPTRKVVRMARRKAS